MTPERASGWNVLAAGDIPVSPADTCRPLPLDDRNLEFDQFYRAEVSKLLRFLAFRGAQPADAADAAHQAFVEVFLRWVGFVEWTIRLAIYGGLRPITG
jgi:hypothetical protein